ncbi:Holliday junction endonuclease RuvC [Fontimonas thermophila]|uniref:Crossover junction endodeoxyribonuclease RuvC n=1 Tax=Fontimonas thermophila TaxID=1076937 RepID=A0A1I2HQC8_9GAMM|nr:crossover junction endodeoxyribonuclease RuvC [Fontimonas thermophila]SFF32059.1 Holliday junction endonuclease RuvC [Fontimonas thermophila]
MTRILGIDPGSRWTGYGIVDVGHGQQRHVASGRIAAGDGEIPQRLVAIDTQLSALVREYAPEEVAFEEVFVSRNVRSALVLGQARGVALCVVARARLPIAEYAASQVKMALTGSGRAEKEQVQHMVRILLGLNNRLAADAADALAVALTHAQVRSTHLRAGVPFPRSWRRR